MTPHPVYYIHDKLDREAPEGLQKGNEDAWRDAERRFRTAAHGQDSHGQEVITEAGAENRSRQDSVPGLMKTAEGKKPASFLPNKIDIFVKSKESENSERTHYLKHYPNKEIG